MVRVTGCSFDAAVIDVQKGQVETTGDECNLQDWSKWFS